MANEITKPLKIFFDRHQKSKQKFGTLGHPDGSLFAVDDAGVTDKNYVWVRGAFGDDDNVTLRIVRCRKVTPLYGSSVIIQASTVDGEYEVIEEDPIPTMNAAGDKNINVPSHSWQHRRFGTDPVYLDAFQFMPLLCRPNSPLDLNVYVEKYSYVYSSTNKVWLGGTIDLTALVPADINMQVVAIISLDPATNTLNSTGGTEKEFFGTSFSEMPFTETDAAAISTGTDIRIAAVRLYGGQTQIGLTDFICDLRQSAGTLSPGSLLPDPVTIAHGGVGFTTYTTGDLLYASNTNVLSKLAIDTATKVLVNAGGVPNWHALIAADIPQLAHSSLSGLTTGDDHTQYLLRQPSADWTIDNSGLRMGAIGGPAVASQKLTIYTGADANKGIQIRQNSITQNGNLFEVTNSAGAFISGIDKVGRLGIGVSPSSISAINAIFTQVSGSQSVPLQLSHTTVDGTKTNNTIGLSVTYTGTTDVTSTQRALQFIYQINGSGGATVGDFQGGVFDVRANQASPDNLLALFGVQTILRQQNSGTLTELNGVAAIVLNPIGGSGLIGDIKLFYARGSWTNVVATNSHGLYIQDMGASGIVNSYGIRILNQLNASGTRFAIQTNAGNVVFNESGDASTDFRVEGDTDQNLLFTKASTDRVGIGIAAPTTKLHSLLTDAGTNAVVNVLTVGHDSSGTPAANYGTGVIIEGKSSTTASQSMGRFTYEWATATHATRKALAKWTVFDTAEREGIRIEASGTAPLLGFYGHASAAQALAYTPTNVTADRSYDANSTTVDEIADVLGTLIADLQATGLIG